jgi:hypothetical protein
MWVPAAPHFEITAATTPSAGMLRRAVAKIDDDGTLVLDFTQVAIGQQGLDELLPGKDRPEAHVAEGVRLDAQGEHKAVHLVDWRREPRVQTDAVRNSLVQCLHLANPNVEPTEVRPLRRERKAVQLGPEFRIAVCHMRYSRCFAASCFIWVRRLSSKAV